ncbi:hypothetical protein DPMN_177209 [Dreissena polymorpha]|nr:hypothetical protein DPMN_177209 [Dreissena polymorpha]
MMDFFSKITNILSWTDVKPTPLPVHTDISLNCEQNTYKCSEINKRLVGKVILRFCGNEASTNKQDLRRLLQALISYIPEANKRIWNSAEITIFDDDLNQYTIVSGNGDNKFIISFDEKGHPQVLKEKRYNTFLGYVMSFWSWNSIAKDKESAKSISGIIKSIENKN